MTEASDSQCFDRRKQNSILPASIKQQHILFRPLRKIPLSQWRIWLVLPHSIFRHFSYHEKSFLGCSKKNLQFQEESDEESRRSNLQPLFELVANCSEQTANQNTNILAEVCKVARKRTSGLTVSAHLLSGHPLFSGQLSRVPKNLPDIYYKENLY